MNLAILGIANLQHYLVAWATRCVTERSFSEPKKLSCGYDYYFEVDMNKVARYEEKLKFVLCWVLEFQYTTPKLICNALGLNRANQGHFFKSLKNTGLFHFIKNPLISEQIILLSHIGKKHSAMFSDKAEKYYMTKTKVVNSTTIHNFCIQQSIINRLAPCAIPFQFAFERHLADMDSAKKPDAIIFDPKFSEPKNGIENKIALEVELTRKSTKRIYLGFFDQIESMKQGFYSKVVYVFHSDDNKKIYEKLFNQELWPNFYRDSHGKIKQHIEDGDVVLVNTNKESIRSRFIFITEELY